MLTTGKTIEQTGLDAAALKPAECDVSRAVELPFETVAIDYEGRDHLPDAETLAGIARETDVRLTTPVRADGFDPLGDDALYETIPEGVQRVAVAGHAAYLTDEERRKAVAPRLRAAVERDPAAWVGTEGVERLALATGATQFELLSRTTARDLRALRAAGFDGRLAVYAPTVLTDDEDEILDAVGGYVARRGPVADALSEDAATGASADGRAREVLTAASRDYALVGAPETVGERVARLREAGADLIVGYPARGIEEFLD
ncbi:luciferase [Halobacteriales archaeon QS_1_67_19]|nr:MAG: luciferase [Halobacteriales archaeon QS_1_67_19]